MPHPPALPHGPLSEVFPNVFAVEGTYRFAPGLTIPRVMTVVREGESLVLISPVRLDEAGEAALTKLGNVEHVVKLGDMHSHDDRYYQDRFHPRFWAAADAQLPEGVKATDPLVEGGPLPIADATWFRFHIPQRPESAMLLAREGGVLLTVDSLQFYDDLAGPRFSFLGKQVFRLMGFTLGMNIGPGWRKQFEPKDGVGFQPDFRRLLQLPFRHLVAAHGAPCRDHAHEAVAGAVAKVYPKT